MSHFACADGSKGLKPYDVTYSKASSVSSSNRFLNESIPVGSMSNDLFNNDITFLSPQNKGYYLSSNNQGVFGDEFSVGMKFADWFSLRLDVIKDENSGVFLSRLNNGLSFGPQDYDMAGFQLGVSSVLNISDDWRLGLDVEKGRVSSDLVGLYQNQYDTTSLGFGVRNNKFGATFQSDFINNSNNTALYQSTMDLQVDWHFTKEGTISFGARRNINDDSSSSSLDDLTGTVPYIKFKHKL